MEKRSLFLVALTVIGASSAAPGHTIQSVASQAAREQLVGTIDEPRKTSFNVAMGPEGPHAAWPAKRGDKWTVVVDGKDGPVFDRVVGSPLFSPDGRHLAFFAQRHRKIVAVLDGTEGPEMDDVDFLSGGVFSANSESFAYLGHRIIIDRKAAPMIKARYIDRLQFSPDGLHVAYEVHDMESGKLTYSAVVIDGVERKHYDEIQGGSLRFGADGSAGYAARFGKELFWVTQPLARTP